MPNSNLAATRKQIFTEEQERIRRRVISFMRKKSQGRLDVAEEELADVISQLFASTVGASDDAHRVLVERTLAMMLKCGDLRYHNRKYVLHRRRWARRKRKPVRPKMALSSHGDLLPTRAEAGMRKKPKRSQAGSASRSSHRRPRRRHPVRT
jgi:hypothetical protein